MTGWQPGRLNLQSSDDIFAEVPDNVGRLIVCLVTAYLRLTAQNESERETGQAETLRLQPGHPHIRYK